MDPWWCCGCWEKVGSDGEEGADDGGLDGETEPAVVVGVVGEVLRRVWVQSIWRSECDAGEASLVTEGPLMVVVERDAVRRG
jgi:hypothetical protein